MINKNNIIFSVEIVSINKIINFILLIESKVVSTGKRLEI